MKLSRKQLRSIIREAMYSPSRLINIALDDPRVDNQIKYLLKQDPLQGLEFLRIMNPEYENEIAAHGSLNIAQPEYRQKFEASSDRMDIMIDQIRAIAYQNGIALGPQDIDVYEEDINSNIPAFAEIYADPKTVARSKQALDNIVHPNGMPVFTTEFLSPGELRVTYY